MKKQTNLQLFIFNIFNLVEHSSDICQVVFVCIYTHRDRYVVRKVHIPGQFSVQLWHLQTELQDGVLTLRDGPQQAAVLLTQPVLGVFEFRH